MAELAGRPPLSRWSDWSGGRSPLVWLIVTAVAITAVSAVARILGSEVISGDGPERTVVEFLDVNRDHSIATYYTTALLAVASLMSTKLGIRKDGGNGARWYWTGIAVALAVLALEEAVGAVAEVGDSVGAAGAAVAGVAAVALATLYLGFLGRLGSPVRGLLVAAATIYIVGGLGLEALARSVLNNLDLPREDILKAIEQHFEELAEMIGISICIQALVIRLARRSPPPAISA